MGRTILKDSGEVFNKIQYLLRLESKQTKPLSKLRVEGCFQNLMKSTSKKSYTNMKAVTFRLRPQQKCLLSPILINTVPEDHAHTVK